MKNKNDVYQLVIGFTVIIALSYLFIYILRQAWNALSSIDEKLSIAIIGGCVTIVISVISTLYAKHLENKIRIENEHKEKKIPIYTELIEFIFKIFEQSKAGNNISKEEIESFNFNFAKKLLIWGSDDVINEFNNFKSSANVGGHEPVLFATEKLWMAIRKDLGHKNKNITKGKLLGLIITDIDNHL